MPRIAPAPAPCLLLSLLIGCESPQPSSLVVQHPESGTALLPQDPAVQSILIAGIAQKVARRLEETQSITVRSTQLVSFATQSLEGMSALESAQSIRDTRAAIVALPHTALEVLAESVMTQHSMRTTFRRRSSLQPETILELTRENGEAMLQETHWYADRQAYLRGEPYVIEDPSGVDGLKVEHTLWADIQSQGAPVCALAEFYYNWLGEHSHQRSAFREIISESVAVSASKRDGEDVFILIRPCYDKLEASMRSTRTDQFFIDKEFQLVGWNSLYTHAKFGSRVAYMAVDRTYTYSQGVEE